MGIRIRSPFIKTSNADLQRKSGVISVGTVQGLQQWAEVNSVLSQWFAYSKLSKLNLETVEGQSLAFGRCAPVASIIGRLAEYSTNGKYLFTDPSGKEVSRVNNNLYNILQKPNLMQNWNEFISSAMAFIKLHGQCYILPVFPSGFEKVKGAAKSLYVVPNWMVTPVYTGKSYLQVNLDQVVTGYRLTGTSEIIPPDQLIIVRDSMPNVQPNNNQKVFEGMSRLYSLSDQVNNLIAAQDALYALTTKRGAMGAWVPENSKDGIGTMLPIDPKEKAEIDAAFSRYGVNSTQSPFMVLRQGMKWVQASMSVTDLKLFEGNEAGITQVAMAFNLPVYLLGFKDSTFTNLETAGKYVYTSAVIPTVNNICSVLTSFFGLDGIALTAYFDHLDIFQKSKKDEADALAAMTGALDVSYKNLTITKAEYRKLLSKFMPVGMPFDAENPDGNQYYQPIQTKAGQ